MVWSKTESVDFFCEESGLFEIRIKSPMCPGPTSSMHLRQDVGRIMRTLPQSRFLSKSGSIGGTR